MKHKTWVTHYGSVVFACLHVRNQKLVSVTLQYNELVLNKILFQFLEKIFFYQFVLFNQFLNRKL